MQARNERRNAFGERDEQAPDEEKQVMRTEGDSHDACGQETSFHQVSVVESECSPDGTAHRLEEQIEFLMEIAVALQAYGEPAHTLEDTMRRVAANMHVESAFFVTPTALYASFGHLGALHTRMVRVEVQRIDLGRLRFINEVANAVASGELSSHEGVLAVREIVARPARRSSAWWTILLPALQAAAITLVLEGSLLDMGVSTALGVGTGLLVYVFGRSPRAALLLAFFAALYGGFSAFALEALQVPISPYIVTVCSVVALMPGLSFTTAILELSTRNLTAGTARLMGALLVLLQLGAGLAFGVLLAHLVFDVSPMLSPKPPAPHWLVFCGAAVFSVSLYLDFRAARSDFIWIFLGGLVTFSMNFWVRGALGVQAGIFCAALVAGVAAEAYTRRTGRPVSVVLVPSITLLVPGILGFRSVSSLVLDDVQGGLALGFSMGMTGVALASGVLVASVMFDSTRSVFRRSEDALARIWSRP